MFLLEELRTRHFFHFFLVQVLSKFSSNLQWLQPASSRFLFKSPAAQLGILIHPHECIHLSAPHGIHSSIHFFTCNSYPTSYQAVPPKTTAFCSCNTHMRECKRQFILQILMTLYEHSHNSAQPGSTVVPSHMVESLLYMETESQKEEKLPFSVLSCSYQVVLGNFLGVRRFGLRGN